MSDPIPKDEEIEARSAEETAGESLPRQATARGPAGGVAVAAPREARHPARAGGALQERAWARRGPPSAGHPGRRPYPQVRRRRPPPAGHSAQDHAGRRRVGRLSDRDSGADPTRDLRGARGSLRRERWRSSREAHTTEGLLLAALSAEEEPEDGSRRAFSWRPGAMEQGEAEKRASEDARTSGTSRPSWSGSSRRTSGSPSPPGPPTSGPPPWLKR